MTTHNFSQPLLITHNASRRQQLLAIERKVGESMGVRGREDRPASSDDILQRMNIFSHSKRGITWFLSLSAWAVMATTVFAHPGHSLSESGASHLFSSPDHAAMLALFGIATAVTSHWIAQRSARLVLRSCALAAFIGAVVLWQV